MNEKVSTFLQYSIVFGFIIIVIWLLSESSKFEVTSSDAKRIFKDVVYDGVLTNKFVDKEQHNYKKIILKDFNGRESTHILDLESGGLYDYLEIGDTIYKKRGELFLKLKRKKIDTIIHLKFW
jgi:hypothetical protein